MGTKADISNYYEDLVVDTLVSRHAQAGLTRDEFDDAACLALNHLPARYYRHSVDMAFFLTGSERERMQQRVIEAVDGAVERITSNRGQR